jgi:hypothetical protein
MQLTKLPLIGLIIGFVVLLIAVAVFIGVSIFVYKKAVKPAAQKSGLVTAGNDLLATGEEAQAVILEVRETGLTVKEHSEIELLLEVRPEHGQTFRVRMTRAVYRLNVPLFQPGAKLKVKYDPDDTSNACSRCRQTKRNRRQAGAIGAVEKQRAGY